MGTKMLIYFWMFLSVALVVLPLAWGMYWLGKKLGSYFRQKALLIKENADIKHIKSELEQQKEDFISANEYREVEDEKSVDGAMKAESGESSEQDGDTLGEVSVEEAESVFSDLLKEADEKKHFQEKEKKRFETLLLEAELLKNEGKVEQYEKKLIEAMAVDKESLKVLKLLSDLYFTLGNYKKALPLLKQISEKDPTDHRAIWQIAEIYFVTGDTQTAELLAEKAIDLKNDNPKYYLTMVEIYYNTDRHEDAVAYMEKIIKLRPTNPKYLLATAELYEHIGDKDNARKYYFNVLEYEQNNEKAKAKIKEFTREV